MDLSVVPAAVPHKDMDLPNVVEVLQDLKPETERILALTLEELELEAPRIIPQYQLPSDEFIGTLNVKQKMDVLRGCLLVYVLSKGKAVPRDFQLQTCLGPLDGRDTVLCSGTGSGKTLVLILLLLLRPNDISLLVVPLKRLQLVQVNILNFCGSPCSRS